MPKQTFTFVDLFAGCGGLSLGLEFAGFEPLAFSEINHDARDTYLLNRHHVEHLDDRDDHGEFVNWYKDAKDLVNKDKATALLDRHEDKLRDNELDLVCGGPPCQGFSRYGIRRTFTALEKEDMPTNHLYVDMAKIVANLHPRMFLFENVQGLTTARWNGENDGEKGEVFDDVVTAFLRETEGKYQISWDLVHGYGFGVPQNRPRIIMVGVHKDVFKELPEGRRKFQPGREKLEERADESSGSIRPPVIRGVHKWAKKRILKLIPEPEPTADKPATIPEFLSDLVQEDFKKNHVENIDDLASRRNNLVVEQYPVDAEVNQAHSWLRVVPVKVLEKWKTRLGKKSDLTESEQRVLKFAKRLLVDRVEIPAEDKHRQYETGKLLELKQGDPVFNHVYSLHRPTTIERFKKIVEGEWKDAKAAGVAQPNKFSQRRLPTDWENGTPKITITSMPDDFVHYKQPRSLTVRECARLQTFPDWYVFDGKRTTGGRRRAGDYEVTDGNDGPDPEKLVRDVPQYTQVGNAVPVWMAREIGKHLIELLTSVKT